MKHTTLMLLLLICMLSARAQAVLYNDLNYGGTAVSFPAGNYRLADMNAAGFPDDAVSSFAIPAGYQVTFYADDNFTGLSFTATASSTWIGASWNDQVTSFIV